jgi:hypothetical protein
MASDVPSAVPPTGPGPARTLDWRGELKRWIGPLYRQKTWIERLQYGTRPIVAGQAGHDLTRARIAQGSAAVGKIGESELRGLVCYLRNRDSSGHCERWDTRSQRLYTNAGVFPADADSFSRFGREYVDALGETDILAVWFNRGEARVVNRLAPQAQLVRLNTIEPHLWDNPWFALAEGKRVLAISPFAATIRHQHDKLEAVWNKKPEMGVSYSLSTIETPLCAALVESPYATWGDGLDAMRDEMASIDFDIAIIGAGAWSLPLAVHAKRLGKIGVHLGGPAQLVFGVLGQRWIEHPRHNVYFNEHWVRPGDHERPETFTKIEGGCYW